MRGGRRKWLEENDEHMNIRNRRNNGRRRCLLSRADAARVREIDGEIGFGIIENFFLNYIVLAK